MEQCWQLPLWHNFGSHASPPAPAPAHVVGPKERRGEAGEAVVPQVNVLQLLQVRPRGQLLQAWAAQALPAGLHGRVCCRPAPFNRERVSAPPVLRTYRQGEQKLACLHSEPVSCSGSMLASLKSRNSCPPHLQVVHHQVESRQLAHAGYLCRQLPHGCALQQANHAGCRRFSWADQACMHACMHVQAGSTACMPRLFCVWGWGGGGRGAHPADPGWQVGRLHAPGRQLRRQRRPGLCSAGHPHLPPGGAQPAQTWRRRLCS